LNRHQTHNFDHVIDLPMSLKPLPIPDVMAELDSPDIQGPASTVPPARA